jgi:hypothetical protein
MRTQKKMDVFPGMCRIEGSGENGKARNVNTEQQQR